MGKTVTISRSASRQAAIKANPNSLAIKRHDLLAEWDWGKNEELGLTPDTATCGMNRTVFWVCPVYHHSYDMNIDVRVRSKAGCPYCSGKRVLAGFNDLATTHPDITSEWVQSVDGKATPQTVSAGSHAMVQWKCSKHGRVWTATVSDRTSGRSCLTCGSEKISAARSRVKPGNSLAEAYPEVASEWDYERNEKTPSQVSAHAKASAYWVCTKHEKPFKWSAAIYSRTARNPSGCPACATESTTKALTTPAEGRSLGDIYPDSTKEWAYDLNGGLTPFDVKPSCQSEVTWRCSICGSTWKTTVGSRTQGHTFKLGCRACKNKAINPKRTRPRTRGYLKDMYPNIAAEWDDDKNAKLLGVTLDNISSTSNIIAWWTCPYGHSYQTSVNHRVSRGDGCSVCATVTHVSYPEKAVFFYVSRLFDDAQENARPGIEGLGNSEFDIWIPTLRTAIEYDGHFWHQDTGRDKQKDAVCKEAGVRMIRVREHGCPTYVSSAMFVNRETVYDSWSLDKAIRDVLALLGSDDCSFVDTKRDEADIRALVGANVLLP